MLTLLGADKATLPATSSTPAEVQQNEKNLENGLLGKKLSRYLLGENFLGGNELGVAGSEEMMRSLCL